MESVIRRLYLPIPRGRQPVDREIPVARGQSHKLRATLMATKNLRRYIVTKVARQGSPSQSSE
jgi:hypothetical protein